MTRINCVEDLCPALDSALSRPFDNWGRGGAIDTYADNLGDLRTGTYIAEVLGHLKEGNDPGCAQASASRRWVNRWTTKSKGVLWGR